MSSATPEEIIARAMRDIGYQCAGTEDARNLVAALTAAGYSIVPTEPTDEMVLKTYNAFCAEGLIEGSADISEEEDLAATKRAMISAAVKEG